MNVAQVIEACGGPGALAAKIGREVGAVRMMKHRNVIPRAAWPEIIANFPAITLEVLMTAEAISPRRERSAA